nr:MAG TPA: hypothetical protein [Caudoviricetes sp.]
MKGSRSYKILLNRKIFIHKNCKCVISHLTINFFSI